MREYKVVIIVEHYKFKKILAENKKQALLLAEEKFNIDDVQHVEFVEEIK